MLKAEPCLYPQFSLKPSGVSGNVYWAELTSGMLLAISWGVNQCCHWDQRFQACWWWEAYNHVLQVKVLKQSWPGFISFGEFKKKIILMKNHFLKMAFICISAGIMRGLPFTPSRLFPPWFFAFRDWIHCCCFFFFFFSAPKMKSQLIVVSLCSLPSTFHNYII